MVEQPKYDMLTRNKVEKEFAYSYQRVRLVLTVIRSPEDWPGDRDYNHGISGSSWVSSKYTIVERMRIGSVSRNGMPKRKSYHSSSQMSMKFDISPASKTSPLMLVNTSVKPTIMGASHLYRTYKSVSEALGCA